MKGGLDGQADSSSPLPRSLFVPYFSILPSPSYLLPSLCSLFPALCSLFVPYSFPIFTQISPHFPTWARICAPFHLFPYLFSHLDIPVRLYFRAKTPLCMHPDAPIQASACPYAPG